MRHKNNSLFEFAGPIRWVRLTYEEALREEHRFLDCFSYKECLQKAADEKWEGFSCSECIWFKLLKGGEEDELRDIRKTLEEVAKGSSSSEELD